MRNRRTPPRPQTASSTERWQRNENSKPALKNRDNVTRLDKALPDCFSLDGDSIPGSHHGSIIIERPIGEAARHGDRGYHGHTRLVRILARLAHLTQDKNGTVGN